MDLGVRDRGYLLFGGTRGMGLAAARTLAADGAKLAIIGRDAERSAEMATALQDELRTTVVALAGDLTVAGEADRLVAEAAAALGELRGVAVTTGLGGRGHQGVLTASDDDWMATVDDVLMATVRVCRAAIPRLIDGGGGSIVTTAAYSIRAPKAHQAPYVTMKSAVATFTKSLATGYGGDGIRANCVCPGATETDILASLRPHYAGELGVPEDEALERVMVEQWGMRVALGRLGRPEELGDVIAFLLSERASYLTGALINVDGGTDF